LVPPIRIGLDVFGIDLALVDGRILVFEANACMSFVGARYGTDDRYEYLDNYVKEIRPALKKLLVKA
jgi:glutathione synthase/RimK-type ligase-like ATP-grasp enzyme